uniref:Cytochrome b5 heme-binding domain-containing protein n=1 Tax=Caenorhabditis tropicalis TaxID=1561998 RepID=A0A1I7TWM4_9PELO
MQVGEYELTLTDVAIFVMIVVALKKSFKWLLAANVVKPTKYQVQPLEKQDMTIEEVTRMRSEEKRCLVVVYDKIYDMSSSQDLYHNNREVFETRFGCGPEWEPICARKYPFVGRLLMN